MDHALLRENTIPGIFQAKRYRLRVSFDVGSSKQSSLDLNKFDADGTPVLTPVSPSVLSFTVIFKATIRALEDFSRTRRKKQFQAPVVQTLDSAIQRLNYRGQGLKRILLLIVSVRIASHAEVLRHGFVSWERTVGPVVLCQMEGLSLLTSSSEARSVRAPRTRVSLSLA